jgi:hypothetical protein
MEVSQYTVYIYFSVVIWYSSHVRLNSDGSQLQARLDKPSGSFTNFLHCLTCKPATDWLTLSRLDCASMWGQRAFLCELYVGSFRSQMGWDMIWMRLRLTSYQLLVYLHPFLRFSYNICDLILEQFCVVMSDVVTKLTEFRPFSYIVLHRLYQLCFVQEHHMHDYVGNIYLAMRNVGRGAKSPDLSWDLPKI